MISWKPILSLVTELKRCDEYNITTAAVAMAYICIDALANLSRPIDKKKVTRSDFKKWVDKYLQGHPDQPYQYRGKDVYAARCALLHTYGAVAEMHNKDSDVIIFTYHNGGRHAYEPKVRPDLAIIGTKSFINDVVIAIESFLDDCKKDEFLKQRVESRLDKVFQVLPYSSQ